MWAGLGPTGKATVYAVELLGILYSLTTAVMAQRELSKVTLFAENQAAIQSIKNPRGQPSGQTILKQITNFITILCRRMAAVEIYWIPAYIGTPSNEKADKIAKQATGWRGKGRTGPRAPQSKLVP
jgi:ribonuclease HI